MTEPLEGARLGGFLVDRGLITSSQLQEALAEQRAFATRGLKLYLGQILMRRRWITSTQLVEALRSARRAPVVCTRCGPQGIREFSDEMPECPSCGGPLRPASATEIASVTPVPISGPGGGGALLFDRYAILGEIGAGGMARVFKAHDTKLDRVVALKLIRSAPGEGRAFRERFLREAKITARLTHPNIVRVHDYDADDDFLHFTMDLIDGRPLDQRLEGEDLDLRRRVGIIRDVARALHYAHEHGVVHRDVKPSNILIGADETPYLVDFGIAREQGLSQMTQEGQPIGTPYYMSPEHARGELGEIDARSDVYSLGAVLYEALTGSPPFTGASSGEIIERVLRDDPEPPSARNPQVPRELDNVTLKALAKSKGARYASAAGIARDLDAYLGGQPVSANPTRRWPLAAWARRRRAALGIAGATLLGVAAVLLAVLLFWPSIRSSAPPHWLVVEGNPTWAVAPRPVTCRQYGAFWEAFGRRRMFLPDPYLELGAIPDTDEPIRGLRLDQARTYCLSQNARFLASTAYDRAGGRLHIPDPPVAIYVDALYSPTRIALESPTAYAIDPADERWQKETVVWPSRALIRARSAAALEGLLGSSEPGVRAEALRFLLPRLPPDEARAAVDRLLREEQDWEVVWAAASWLAGQSVDVAAYTGRKFPWRTRLRLFFAAAWMGQSRALDELRILAKIREETGEAADIRKEASAMLLWLEAPQVDAGIFSEAPSWAREPYERRFGRPR